MELTWEQGAAVLAQLAMGISLAACAGLRAFLPLFVVGLGGKLDYLPLSDSFEWLASWPALIVFGSALVVEIVADKFPVVDNFLDLVQTFVKPIAGTVLVACLLTDLTPLQGAVLGIVLGGASAGGVHLVKAKLRLFSSVASAGIGNPVLSTVEDTGAVLGSVGAILMPITVLVGIVLFVVFSWAGFRRLRRQRAGDYGTRVEPATTPQRR